MLPAWLSKRYVRLCIGVVLALLLGGGLVYLIERVAGGLVQMLD